MDELKLEHGMADENTLQIKIEGRLCIDTANELLALLRDKIPNATRIKLDVAGISEIDLPGLQLICSACRTALVQNRKFGFKTELPENMKAMVDSIGLQRSVICKHNADMACIWSGGLI